VRYSTAYGERNYYISYTSYSDALRVLPLYFIQEKYAQAAEIIFRLKHMITSASTPKATYEFPSLNRLIPAVLAWDSWYNARFTKDVEHQRILAWTAIYWFIEDILRNAPYDNVFYCDDFGSADAIYACLGEFELLGAQQKEFLENFKTSAMFASMSFCQKMIEDPTPMIPFPERKLPTIEECKRMYDDMFPSQA
jgi:hypothetical protein